MTRSLAVAIMLCTAGAPAQAQNSIRAVVLSHLDPVPGVPGAVFSNTTGPQTQLDSHGRVSFATTFSGPLGSGVWSEGSGTLRLIAIEGGPVPGVPGATFRSFNGVRVAMSDNDRVAFCQQLNYQFTPFGVWSQEGPDLALVAMPGQPAPSSPPGLWRIDNAIPVQISCNGRVAFAANFMVGNGNYNALFSGVPSGMFMCARTELQAGIPGFTGFGDPQINDAYVLGVQAPYRNDDGTRSGIWQGACAQLQVVAIQQMTIPDYVGLPPYETMISPTQFCMNGANAMAFVSSLNGSDVNQGNDTCIWTFDGFHYRIIAREGAQVPGLPAGVTFSDFRTGSLIGPLLSKSGHVVFHCSIAGTGITSDNNRAIFQYSPDGSLRVIARKGDMPPPGYSAPAQYSGFGFGGLAINSWGQVCFAANVANAPGRGANILVATDLSGSPHLLLEAGTTATVRPGMTLRLNSFTEPQVAGGTDGRSHNWNDRGQLGLRIGYSVVGNPNASGVGVFVIGLPFCAADFNHDAFLDFFDVDGFIAAFEAGDPAADFNEDGFLDFFDADAFTEAFEAGC